VSLSAETTAGTTTVGPCLSGGRERGGPVVRGVGIDAAGECATAVAAPHLVVQIVSACQAGQRIEQHHDIPALADQVFRLTQSQFGDAPMPGRTHFQHAQVRPPLMESI